LNVHIPIEIYRFDAIFIKPAQPWYPKLTMTLPKKKKILINICYKYTCKNPSLRDFPGGPVVKTLPFQYRASLVTQMVKNLPAVGETQI